jgi:predicted MFS family arabinose efflux permease
LELEYQQKKQRHNYTLLQAFVNPKVWLLSLIYFTLVIGLYGISFWLPQIIKGFSGLNNFWVGLVSAIPYLVGAIGMLLVSSHSDRTKERRAHVAIPAFIGAFGLVLTAFFHHPVAALAALSLAALGIWSALGPFWALPTGFLSGTAAAGSLALINSVGNLGGFVSPYIIGLIKDATHSFTGGLLVMATALIVGGSLVLVVRHE